MHFLCSRTIVIMKPKFQVRADMYISHTSEFESDCYNIVCRFYIKISE
jgi:hypothetical protein